MDVLSTYRIQLSADRGFASVAAALPDLALLGVSHVYLSPVAEAVPGSAHGYDVVDPTAVRAELGGEQGLRDLIAAARSVGMGVVIDVVPNHMAAHPTNPWWWKVLRLGRQSLWAPMFDIDWDPPKPQLRETVLVPVLADHYGRELEAGRIRLHRGAEEGRILTVRYYEHVFPVSPSSTAALLLNAARVADDDVLGVAARVMARVEDETIDLEARDTDLHVAERTALARLRDPRVGGALDDELVRVHADVDAFDTLLADQHYRLARWQVGASEIDYRRFFDIDTLVALRTDRADVFELVHRLPLQLLEEGVDGLRVDHIDGLRDPGGYVERLRAAAPPGTWIVMEKILAPDEELPASWPIDGTTGYEVADLLGRWLTDPHGANALTDAWREWTGERRSYAEVERDARRLVLTTSLAADVERVTDAMVAVCEQRRRHRDHPRTAVRDALVEFAVHASAYRSYVRYEDGDPRRPLVSAADEAFVEAAMTGARDDNPAMDPELFDLIGAVVLGRLRGPSEAEVTLRLQQLCAPAAAKGVEDTALYRWLPLPHRCEVGANPSMVTADADDWHRACVTAQARWPRRMTTLATHDSKRSADVRARLAALTTVPDVLLDGLKTWWADAGSDVDPADGWLVFHALVGAHPLPSERAWVVVEKSIREAKVRTSWTDPNIEYENAVRRLVEASGGDASVARVALAAVDAGWAAGLAQLALQLLAPGVPDLYQGAEGWDLSLVDPDNRRPLDLDRLHRLAGSTGEHRTAMLRACLGVRRRHPDAVAGAYVPLAVSGEDADRGIAFGRGDPVDVIVAACRAGTGSRIRAGATAELPEGEWTDVLTGTRHRGAIDLGDRAVPIALLERRSS